VLLSKYEKEKKIVAKYFPTTITSGRSQNKIIGYFF
jgi:ribosomal protein S17E